MNYGYELNRVGNTWILLIDHQKPMYFHKMYEALEIILQLRLHVKPQHLPYVA